VHTGFYLESLKGRGHLEDLVADGRITLKIDLKETGCGRVV